MKTKDKGSGAKGAVKQLEKAPSDTGANVSPAVRQAYVALVKADPKKRAGLLAPLEHAAQENKSAASCLALAKGCLLVAGDRLVDRISDKKLKDLQLMIEYDKETTLLLLNAANAAADGCVEFDSHLCLFLLAHIFHCLSDHPDMEVEMKAVLKKLGIDFDRSFLSWKVTNAEAKMKHSAEVLGRVDLFKDTRKIVQAVPQVHRDVVPEDEWPFEALARSGIGPMGRLLEYSKTALQYFWLCRDHYLVSSQSIFYVINSSKILLSKEKEFKKESDDYKFQSPAEFDGFVRKLRVAPREIGGKMVKCPFHRRDDALRIAKAGPENVAYLREKAEPLKWVEQLKKLSEELVIAMKKGTVLYYSNIVLAEQNRVEKAAVEEERRKMKDEKVDRAIEDSDRPAEKKKSKKSGKAEEQSAAEEKLREREEQQRAEAALAVAAQKASVVKNYLDRRLKQNSGDLTMDDLVLRESSLSMDRFLEELEALKKDDKLKTKQELDDYELVQRWKDKGFEKQIWYEIAGNAFDRAEEVAFGIIELAQIGLKRPEHLERAEKMLASVWSTGFLDKNVDLLKLHILEEGEPEQDDPAITIAWLRGNRGEPAIEVYPEDYEAFRPFVPSPKLKPSERASTPQSHYLDSAFDYEVDEPDEDDDFLRPRPRNRAQMIDSSTDDDEYDDYGSSQYTDAEDPGDDGLYDASTHSGRTSPLDFDSLSEDAGAKQSFSLMLHLCGMATRISTRFGSLLVVSPDLHDYTDYHRQVEGLKNNPLQDGAKTEQLVSDMQLNFAARPILRGFFYAHLQSEGKLDGTKAGCRVVEKEESFIEKRLREYLKFVVDEVDVPIPEVDLDDLIDKLEALHLDRIKYGVEEGGGHIPYGKCLLRSLYEPVIGADDGPEKLKTMMAAYILTGLDMLSDSGRLSEDVKNLVFGWMARKLKEVSKELSDEEEEEEPHQGMAASRTGATGDYELLCSCGRLKLEDLEDLMVFVCMLVGLNFHRLAAIPSVQLWYFPERSAWKWHTGFSFEEEAVPNGVIEATDMEEFWQSSRPQDQALKKAVRKDKTLLHALSFADLTLEKAESADKAARQSKAAAPDWIPSGTLLKSQPSRRFVGGPSANFLVNDSMSIAHALTLVCLYTQRLHSKAKKLCQYIEKAMLHVADLLFAIEHGEIKSLREIAECTAAVAASNSKIPLSKLANYLLMSTEQAQVVQSVTKAFGLDIAGSDQEMVNQAYEDARLKVEHFDAGTTKAQQFVFALEGLDEAGNFFDHKGQVWDRLTDVDGLKYIYNNLKALITTAHRTSTELQAQQTLFLATSVAAEAQLNNVAGKLALGTAVVPAEAAMRLLAGQVLPKIWGAELKKLQADEEKIKQQEAEALAMALMAEEEEEQKKKEAAAAKKKAKQQAKKAEEAAAAAAAAAERAAAEEKERQEKEAAIKAAAAEAGEEEEEEPVAPEDEDDLSGLMGMMKLRGQSQSATASARPSSAQDRHVQERPKAKMTTWDGKWSCQCGRFHELSKTSSCSTCNVNLCKQWIAGKKCKETPCPLTHPAFTMITREPAISLPLSSVVVKNPAVFPKDAQERFEEKRKRMLRQIEQNVRIVSYIGEWICKCDKKKFLHESCDVCGCRNPCRDYVRGICKMGRRCRWPHLPIDVRFAKPVSKDKQILNITDVSIEWKPDGAGAEQSPQPQKRVTAEKVPVSNGGAAAAPAGRVSPEGWGAAAPTSVPPPPPPPRPAVAPPKPLPMTPPSPPRPGYPPALQQEQPQQQPLSLFGTAPAAPGQDLWGAPAAGYAAPPQHHPGASQLWGSDQWGHEASSSSWSSAAGVGLSGHQGLLPSQSALYPNPSMSGSGDYSSAAFLPHMEVSLPSDLLSQVGGIAGTEPEESEYDSMLSDLGVVQDSAWRSAVMHSVEDEMGRVAAPGLANEVGEYNCFLNVVIQCLWHCTDFRNRVMSWPPHIYMADPVVYALRNLFGAFAQRESEKAAGLATSRAVVNPSELREALATLPGGNFGLGEMNDAAELLMTLYSCTHEVGPDGAGAVDTTFGLRVRECVRCNTCKRPDGSPLETHENDYVQYFFNVPATALRLMRATYGAAMSTSQLLRAIEQQTMKSCDTEKGGCDKKLNVRHTIVNPPSVFTLQLAWESTAEQPQDIRLTLDCVQEAIRLGDLYSDIEAESPPGVYRLRAAVAYYGAHYSAFVFSHELQCWAMFDDSQVSKIGTWTDVVRKCQAGRIQPSILFYSQN